MRGWTGCPATLPMLLGLELPQPVTRDMGVCDGLRCTMPGVSLVVGRYVVV